MKALLLTSLASETGLGATDDSAADPRPRLYSLPDPTGVPPYEPTPRGLRRRLFVLALALIALGLLIGAGLLTLLAATHQLAV